ncbi:MAG TPA: hypothetical protein VIM29_00450 [Bacillota bacterium]
MRKLIISMILGGLLLTAVGCGGGGGGNDIPGTDPVPSPNLNPYIDISKVGEYELNLSYQTTTSRQNPDIVTMTITSIEVQSDKKLKVNCRWTEKIVASDTDFIYKPADKPSDNPKDKGKTDFYIICNGDANNIYYHISGGGAAYNKTRLSSSPVYGFYIFPQLGSTVQTISFWDNVYDKMLGPIIVKR